METISNSRRRTDSSRSGRVTPAWRASAVGLAVAMVAGIGLSHAHASVWSGGNGNWSSNASPGWNGTGVPDAIGATADFPSITTGTTTVDVSARTVGTITHSGSGNIQRTITNTSGLILNADGAGSGSALISNTNTSTGTSNRIAFGSGTYTLNDDLLISNTGGSTNTSGSITFGTITFGASSAGNITFSNVSNVDAGRITVGGIAGSFTGNILIEKGMVALGGGTNAFGPAANALTLGSSGNGGASLVTTGSATNVTNNITVASGSGGTLLLGSSETGVTTSTFSGTQTLNGDLTVTSAKTGAGTVNFSNTFSGAGGLTKIGTGSVTLSGAAGYNGNTTISQGTLILTNAAAINNTPVINLNGGSLDTTAKASFTVGGSQTLKGQGSYAGATTTTVNGTLSVGQTHNVALGTGSIFTVSTGGMALAGTEQFDLASAAGDADKLALTTGSLAYGGTLQVANPNGFAFAAGQSWDLFDFASRSGTSTFTNDNVFTTPGDGTNLPTLTGGLTWAFDYDSGVLSIETTGVPEPTSLGLLALGAIGLLRRRRS